MRYFILCMLVLVSCNEIDKKTVLQKYSDSIIKAGKIDSIYNVLKTSAQHKQDSIDFAKIDNCPIIILKSWVSHNSIGTPEANFKMKNKTKEIIDGIKVGVLCYNNFNDPVNQIYSNEFGGISQKILRGGSTDVYTWSLYSFETTTKIKTYIRQVHFKNGSEWNYDK